MQRLHWWRILWSVVLFVTLLLVSSAAQAGSLQQEEPQPVDTETGPVAPLDPVEEMVSTEGEPGRARSVLELSRLFDQCRRHCAQQPPGYDFLPV